MDKKSHGHSFEQLQWNSLLKVAATSKVEGATKLKHLRLYAPKLPKDLLHAAARSETFTNDILRACTNNYQRANEFYKWTPETGSTALHIAAMSKHQCSEILLQSLTPRTLEAMATVTNIRQETPFSLVLKKNRLEMELRTNKVRILLQNGYKPTVEDLCNGCEHDNADDFKLLFLSGDILAHSKDPLRFLLVLALYCQKRSSQNGQATSKGTLETGKK